MTRDRRLDTPEERRAEFTVMSQRVLDMVEQARDGFAHQDGRRLQAVDTLGRAVHDQEKALVRQLTPFGLPGRPALPDQEAIFIPLHLERVADNLGSFAATVRTKMLGEGVLFTARARHEIVSLMGRAAELLECVRDALRTDNRALIRHVIEESDRYAQTASELARFHEQRLIEGVCLPHASSVYLSLLDSLNGIEWHSRQIALKLLATAPVGFGAARGPLSR